MEMRLAGHTYREIAARLGIAVSAVHRHVQRACESLRQARASGHRAAPPECPLHSPPGIEPEPGSVCCCDPIAVKAALEALDRVLKILAERSRLFGLYPPKP